MKTLALTAKTRAKYSVTEFRPWWVSDALE